MGLIMNIGYFSPGYVTAITSALGILPHRLHYLEDLGLLESTTVSSTNKQILVLTRIPDHRYHSRSLRRASNQLSITEISIEQVVRPHSICSQTSPHLSLLQFISSKSVLISPGLYDLLRATFTTVCLVLRRPIVELYIFCILISHVVATPEYIL